MTQNIQYKVLWIEDNETIVQGTKMKASRYGIQLVHYTNWEEAYSDLSKNFNDYSAIILDAFCKMEGMTVEDKGFINKILPPLERVCCKFHKYMPWYILSAGTMDGFGEMLENAEYQRKRFTDVWGPIYYKKDPDGDDTNLQSLFNQIKEVAKNTTMNVVLFRHQEVFNILGNEHLIDIKARRELLKVLCALYCPEDNPNYEFPSDSLRKVLEYMFRSARKLGLLSDHCFKKNDNIVLADASGFMAGKTIKSKREEGVEIQWGNEGDAIFPKDIASIVWNIIKFSGSDLHTDENEEDKTYSIEDEKKELFFGYTMQLCYVLRWYGKYAQEHNNKETNLAMHKQEPSKSKIKTPEPFNSSPVHKADIIGKEFIVCQDEKFLFAGSCKISAKLKSIVKPFSKVRILDVEDNKDEQSGRYPYIATKVENLQQ